MLLPWLLHRLVRRLDVKWDVEGLINVPTTMIVGLVLVVFSFNLAVPISQLASTVTRATLGIAMATVMLSFLMMITRRKAIPQVIGFLSMENGLFFAATSATYGMPMVVELGIALDVLVGMLILGVFFFQIREQFDSLDLKHLEKLKESECGSRPRDRDPPRPRHCRSPARRFWRWSAIAGRPGRERRREPRDPPRRGRADRAGDPDGPLLVLDRQFFVDPFNVFLVALTAFVGFTTAIFSRPYMRIEEEHKRVTAARLRLYHSMYQLFNFTMLLALLTNNMGILWVAMEAATLTTVLLVSLYRTPASLEAAWKYFILCGVGIAQALFGTILLYFAAEKLLGAGGGALLWTELTASRASSSRPCCRSRSSSCSSATAPRSGWCRCTTGCPTRMRKGPHRCRPCSRASCSTSRSMPWCAARCSWRARYRRPSPRS